MNYFETTRIRLRAIEPGDAEIVHAWNQDSERARMLDFVWPPTSLASVRKWTEQQTQRRLENDAYAFLIETIDGTPVGTIATHDCSPRHGTFSYGIDIGIEHRRKGYASETIRLVLRYYFEELRYQKVNVGVHADNPASTQLHEALGFQREGLLRRNQYTHGTYVDLALYGMTKEEFASLHAGA